MPPKVPPQEEVLFRLPKEDQDNMGITTWQEIYPEISEAPEVIEAQEPAPYLRIGNLAISRLVEVEGGKKLARRNQFIRRGYQWIPAYESEQTLAVQTLPVYITDIASKKDNTLTLVKGALKKIDSYQAESVISLETLKNVAIEDEEGLNPKAEFIKGNPEVVATLARYLRQREMFDSGDWHPRNRNRQLGKKNAKNEQRLLALTAEIEREKDLESLERLWRMAYTSERNRLMYWSSQKVKVTDDRFSAVELVRAALSGR